MRNFMVVIFVLLTVLFVACTPESSRSIGAVEDMGFTDVNLGSHAWYGCGENHSTYTQHFTATRPENNRRVSGIVCCSMWSTCTVRLTR